MKSFILLPSYNEETALGTLIPAIRDVFVAHQMPYRIVIADDGSRDGTAGLLHRLSGEIPIEHLVHAKNQGYGAALNTGYTWIARHAEAQDIALCLDADNTHDPRYFLPMIQKMDEGFDVVTASYTMPGGRVFGVPPRRRVLSFGANLLLRLGAPVKGTRAYTTGFRSIRVELLQRVLTLYPTLIDETGFAGGTELLLRMARAGARTAEIPFDLHYENRGGRSKINIQRTIGCYLRLLTRYGWWRASPALRSPVSAPSKSSA